MSKTSSRQLFYGPRTSSPMTTNGMYANAAESRPYRRQYYYANGPVARRDNARYKTGKDKGTERITREV